MIYRLSADVVLLEETWSQTTGTVQLEGYVGIEKLCAFNNTRACRGTGGLAFLFKRHLLQTYMIKELEHGRDEVMIIHLKLKITGFTVTVIGVYLPPESSIYGQEADLEYESIVNVMFERTDDDLIILLGDLNGRLGKKQDYIPEVDEVPPRVHLDQSLNDYGRALQCKMCVLNGRVCPLQDKYTSISHKARAVVDYIITQHDTHDMIKEFTVITVSDFVEQHNLQLSAMPKTNLRSLHSNV